jgi:hypothetical protein
MSEHKLTDEELSDLCALAYANSLCGTEYIYLACRELIEFRALRDGKAAFAPTVIGEAAQAGAVCDDTESEPATHMQSSYDIPWNERVKSYEP